MATKADRNKIYMVPKFKVRYRNRCHKCGRPRGFIRFFKLCRMCFRELALAGKIPGVRKASW